MAPSAPPNSRPTPFDLAFGPLADERFPVVRDAVGSHDPRDRDAFLMLREVVQVIRELRPDEGVGAGIAELAALVHHAYLIWAEGSSIITLAPGELATMLLGPPAETDAAGSDAGGARYVQLPERRVWAEPGADGTFEPLDGIAVHFAPNGDLRALGIFGLHPERMGFTVGEVIGPRPRGLVRPDGSPLFAPILAGGARAGLWSVIGAEELLELAWRTRRGLTETS
jgi:hypothetical protein